LPTPDNQKLGGLYLIADLSLPEGKLVKSVASAIRGGVQLVQIWNAAKTDEESILRICGKIHSIAAGAGIPLVVNNDVDLAQRIGAGGVHFDDFRTTAADARRLLGSNAIVGYTCGSDEALVHNAEDIGADYISFCAVFPSPSVQTCQIVPLEAVRKAKWAVSIPIFASGGITLENAHLVMEAGADGLVIASSILGADDPEATAKAFRRIIDNYRGGSN
jgi:thiamine-phosphate pyrophosphorylase